MSRSAVNDPAAACVLVLRPGAIGDTLLSYPVLMALKQHVPDAPIRLFGNRVAAPVLAAQHDPDGSPLLADWAAFDDPVVTGLFLPSGPAEATKRALGSVRTVVAWSADPEGLLTANLRRLGAGHVVVAPSRPAPEAGLHVAEHLLRTLRPLGITAGTAPAARRVPRLDVAPDWCRQADALLARLALPGRPFVLVHPGSGSPAKNWPAERFAELVSALPGLLGATGVILAGPADARAAEWLVEALDVPVPVLRDLPLTVVAGLIRRARAYLGNDSGLTHLAGLLGAPTLALFGLTDPVLWAPLGPRVRVLPRQPLHDLAVDDVLTELAHLARA